MRKLSLKSAGNKKPFLRAKAYYVVSLILLMLFLCACSRDTEIDSQTITENLITSDIVDDGRNGTNSTEGLPSDGNQIYGNQAGCSPVDISLTDDISSSGVQNTREPIEDDRNESSDTDRNESSDTDRNESSDTVLSEDSDTGDDSTVVVEYADTDGEQTAQGMLPVLYINEILPTNSKFSKHNNAYYDAIELYNASDFPVNLAGYCLSDSLKKRYETPLPEDILEPGEYAVYYCTGEYAAKSENDLPFELSYFGEKIYLSDLDGNIIDSVSYPEMPKNVSYSRNELGRFEYCTQPTLGAENKVGYSIMLEKPEVTVSPGFYSESQYISFSTSENYETEIFYTLDGSKPDRTGIKWDGKEIEISKSCAVRAVAYCEGCLPSFDVAFVYLINEPEYELGTLLLSIAESDFATMNANYKSNHKYAANIAYFENGSEQFEIDCAVGVFGCTSREYDKKSYEIKFSTDYGPSKLKYRLFDNLNIDEYNSVVLRSGSQDNSAAMLRDEFMSSLAVSTKEVTEVIVQAYKPVNLYVNGSYWGIYYIREHIDADMLAQHNHCDEEQITLIEQATYVKAGKESNEWLNMWNWLKENHLDTNENYEYVKSIVNLESVADYYIIQTWCGNRDLDNVRVYKAANSKWSYILYDLDLTNSSTDGGGVSYVLGKFNSGFYTFSALIYRLMENEEFRELYQTRLDVLLNGPLSEESAHRHLNEMAVLLDHDMQFNCIRWGGKKDSSGKISYKTYNGWLDSIEYLDRMLNGRTDRLRSEYEVYFTNKQAD